MSDPYVFKLDYNEKAVLRIFLGLMCRRDKEKILDKQQMPDRENWSQDEWGHITEEDKLIEKIFRRHTASEIEVMAVDSVLYTIYSKLHREKREKDARQKGNSVGKMEQKEGDVGAQPHTKRMADYYSPEARKRKLRFAKEVMAKIYMETTMGVAKNHLYNVWESHSTLRG